jgi:hypothetical protein
MLRVASRIPTETMDRARSPNDDAVDKIGLAQDRNDVPDSYHLWRPPMIALPYIHCFAS